MLLNELKELLMKPRWQTSFAKSSRPIVTEAKMLMVELTNFLPQNASYSQRAWHILNDTDEIPNCIECGKVTHWGSWNSRTTYSTFCSDICAKNSPLTKEKRRQTVLKKYGTEYVTQSKVFKEKSEATNLKRYGTKSSLSNEDVRNKIKISNLEKYGSENPFGSDEIKNKIKNTMIEKYGVDNARHISGMSDKIKKLNIKKYGVTHPSKLESVKNKNKETNLAKYGKNHMQQHISDDALTLLNDASWLTDQHHNQKKTITEIAEFLGIYDTTLNSYFKKYNIETKHFFTSAPEKHICEFLSTFNIKYIQNCRNVIFPYELDIYLPSHNLAIEYCGLYWHSEIRIPKNYHKNKYMLCKEKGIRLIQIFEHEWLQNKEIVKSKILNVLKISNVQKIFARKTIIKTVESQIKTNFFNQYHIQGNGSSSINYGLTYGNELVAVIGFIKNHDGSFTLNRYATSCRVVGGFSKLLTHFEKQYNTPKIITFADLRWSEGSLYYNNGFILDKELNPDYCWTTGKKIFHKFNFRHAGMKNKLKNYNPSLSETENMHNHHYYRLYDCGKLRFVKNKTS